MTAFRVALTFDTEHPGHRQSPPGAAEAIVAELRKTGVRATFFLQGRWAAAYPVVARSIAAAGHLIGSHSHWHAPMTALTDEGIVRDLEKAERSIREATGVDPRPWFRCPYGDGAEDERVRAALASRGYRNVHWDVAVDDWADDKTADLVENDLIERTQRHGDGGIVLLHSWPAPTVAALPRILARLLTVGARFITVDEVTPR